MNNQNLLIYDLNKLFEILDEIKSEIKFNIVNISKENLGELSKRTYLNDIVVVKEKIPELKNQFSIKIQPIKITKLIEEINIKFLKLRFGQQSEIKINKYTLDLNVREIKFNNLNLKLTEKECGIVTYLKTSTMPVSINELQLSVWGYNSKLDTHTVETHIYRLRKKISEKFNDKDFIKSKKDGYKI